MFPEISLAKDLSLFLEENGFIVPFMNYPSGDSLHMVRIAVSALHTEDQAEELLGLLKRWKKRDQKASK
jgi:7-keto-8-aminopelargonate synthetase-like enzyme